MHCERHFLPLGESSSVMLTLIYDLLLIRS
jgi:hypothetical protein